MTPICRDVPGCDDLSPDCQTSIYASEGNVSGVLGHDYQSVTVVDVCHRTRSDYDEQLEAIGDECLETGTHDGRLAFVHGFQIATVDRGRSGGRPN